MNYQAVNAYRPFLPMATAPLCFTACASIALSMQSGSKVSCMRFFTHVAVETKSVSRGWWRKRIRLILLHFYGSIGIRLILSCSHSLQFPAIFDSHGSLPFGGRTRTNTKFINYNSMNGFVHGISIGCWLCFCVQCALCYSCCRCYCGGSCAHFSAPCFKGEDVRSCVTLLSYRRRFFFFLRKTNKTCERKRDGNEFVVCSQNLILNRFPIAHRTRSNHFIFIFMFVEICLCGNRVLV